MPQASSEEWTFIADDRLRKIHPSELFQPDWIETYEERIKLLWSQLIRINMLMLTLEHMRVFRFDLFGDPSGRNHFWHLVETTFFDAVILAIWRVAVDNSFHHGLTLQQLKNQMNEYFIDPSDRARFHTELRRIDFEGAFSTFKPILRELRSDYLAHWNIGKLLEPSEEDLKMRTLPLEELQKIRHLLNQFFRLLCFGHQRMLLPVDYDHRVRHPDGTDIRTEIERILDLVAKESTLLNLPETNLDHWQVMRDKRFGEEELTIINEYRSKFGLPEA